MAENFLVIENSLLRVLIKDEIDYNASHTQASNFTTFSSSRKKKKRYKCVSPVSKGPLNTHEFQRRDDNAVYIPGRPKFELLLINSYRLLTCL